MAPVPPPLTPHLERCFWRCIPTRDWLRPRVCPCSACTTGRPTRRFAEPRPAGRRRAFHLRYDPSDLGRVAVFEEGVWLGDAYARELRLPDGRYGPASL